MRYLGIDYGKNNLGFSISDGLIARPYDVSLLQNIQIKTINDQAQLKIIKEIIEKENIDLIVLGLAEGIIAEKEKQFGQLIEKETKVTVKYQDETLTSKEAIQKMIEVGKKRSDRKRQEHNFSACLILQEYLDSLS